MSLISSTDYASLTSLEIANTFSCLFSDNTHILNHPTKKMELPATTLANYCYDEMFSGCTGLTKAPELPATTLTPFCYSGMFWRCTGLTKAPELPATTLTPFCYSGMFRGCTSMTEAPALPVMNRQQAIKSWRMDIILLSSFSYLIEVVPFIAHHRSYGARMSVHRLQGTHENADEARHHERVVQ